MIRLNKESTMTFGNRFYGQKLKNVPAWYLLWIDANCKIPEGLKDYIDRHRHQLERERREDNKARFK